MRLIYPSPTVAEVVCKVHFLLTPGASWSPSNPGQLWKEIDQDYPTIEPVIEAGLELKVDEFGNIEPLWFSGEGIASTTKIKPDYTYSRWRVQSECASSIQKLGEMRDELAQIWDNIRKTFDIVSIARVGLRYINKIPRLTADEKTGHWLCQTNYVANDSLSSPPAFLSRVEIKIN